MQQLISQLPDELTLFIANNPDFQIGDEILEIDDAIYANAYYLSLADAENSDSNKSASEFYYVVNSDGLLNKEGIIEWLEQCNELYNSDAEDEGSDPYADDDDDDAPKQVLALTIDGREIRCSFIA